MRWPGFRKVRRQVCKRIDRRIDELGLSDVDSYRSYLEANEGEWKVLDAMSRITISRFYRDRGVFDALRTRVLPAVASTAVDRGADRLRCWSAGCGSGEEPYTLQIIWRLETAETIGATLRLEVVGTDADEGLLARARAGSYRRSSLKDLPENFRDRAFSAGEGGFRLLESFKQDVSFVCQDIREGTPDGSFDIVLCRNLAFTYFDDQLQIAVLGAIRPKLEPGGFLVVGVHEKLPAAAAAREGWKRLETGPGFYVLDPHSAA
jgi:chemotaxis protein methyltransferase CheR